MIRIPDPNQLSFEAFNTPFEIKMNPKKLSKLSREEELEYWRVQTRELREQQRKLLKKVRAKI